ncbi:MAG: di-trans,poly-cis-decaprenylcistransferase [bacterium]|nr:di-trans,poly-cis-decaprenylcistransferase [bacterium]
MSERSIRHLAIIMDGNGRWARERRMLRIEGHRAGVSAVRSAVEHCRRRGIPHLTLFAFSTENWTRPALEVGSLMALLDSYLEAELDQLVRQRIELRSVGNVDALPATLAKRLSRVENETRGLDGMRLTLALSYGGRDEILRATKQIVRDIRLGLLSAEAVDEEIFERRLDSYGTPPPDLVIRTGGEQRLSNFLLWQCAYSELYFTLVHWPDFDEQDLDLAIAWYEGRNRRFGCVDSTCRVRPAMRSATSG